MVKIHIGEREARAKCFVAMARRGRVVCLSDDVFIVPQAALAVLESLGVTYQELGRGGIDYAEKAIRDSLAAQAQ